MSKFKKGMKLLPSKLGLELYSHVIEKNKVYVVSSKPSMFSNEERLVVYVDDRRFFSNFDEYFVPVGNHKVGGQLL